jgi:hypothetical protein
VSFFSPGELADFRAMAATSRPESAVIYRPDYAGSGSPTTIATVACRVVRFVGANVNVLDISGESSHNIHMPAGTDCQEGDEILVNGAERYTVIITNAGRSYDFDLQAAVKRIA